MIPRDILLRLDTAGKPAFVVAIEANVGLLVAHFDSLNEARKAFIDAILNNAAGTALLHLDADVNVTITEIYTRFTEEVSGDTVEGSAMDALGRAVNEAIRKAAEGN